MAHQIIKSFVEIHFRLITKYNHWTPVCCSFHKLSKRVLALKYLYQGNYTIDTILEHGEGSCWIFFDILNGSLHDSMLISKYDRYSFLDMY